MSSFETLIELPATPEVAWAFVVERGEEVEPLRFEPQGAQAVDTLNHLSGREFGVIPIRGVSRTTVWDPPRTCAFESIKPSWPVRARITETLTPANGCTHHSIHYEITPRGWIGRLAAPLFCRVMKRSRRLYQERLRDALAQSATS